MRKVLIVDDNNIQIKSLQCYINWGKYGVTEMKVAYNGKDGIAVAKEFKPDIIIADVEMPVLNGIDMVKEITAEMPWIKTIFISCYEKFEYVKQAMQNNSVAYLLKPIVKEELEQAMERILDISDKERRNEDVDEMLRKNINVLLESLLYRQIYTKQLDFGNYAGLINQLNIENYKKFMIAKIEMEIIEKVFDIDNICRMFSNTFSNGVQGVTVLENGNILNALLMGKEDVTYEYILSKLSEFSNLLDEHGIVNYIGISDLHENLPDINVMICEAETALTDSLSDEEGVLKYDGKEMMSLNIADSVKELLSDYAEDKLKDTVDSICPANAKFSPKMIRSCYVEIIAAVQVFLIDRNLDINEIFGKDGSVVWDSQTRFNSIPEFRHWIVNVLHGASELATKCEQNDHEKIVSDMIEFINQNYNYISNVEQIAESVYVSASYARMIFKKYVGQTVLQYLTSVRMDEAKRLLSNPSSRVYEVAEAVGYKNKPHFVSVFKRQVGMYPNEFKQQVLNGKK